MADTATEKPPRETRDSSPEKDRRRSLLTDPEEIEKTFGPSFVKFLEYDFVRFYQDRIEMDLLREIVAHGIPTDILTFHPPRDNSGLERMMAEKNPGTQAFIAVSTFAGIPVSTVRRELDPDDLQLALEIAGAFLSPGRKTGRRS